MSLWKPVELALTGSARLAWPVFQAVNRRFEGKSFQPRWSAAPLMKSRERSSPALGWPRTTDSLCPSCVRETRARILSGEQSIESLVNRARRRDPGIHSRAGRQDRDREDVPDSRHLHRHALDQSGVPQAHRIALPRARLRRGDGSAPQSRHLLDQAWPWRRAHHRSHQPLQHDVRSLLHGRQSGRLRPRADARRSEAAPRRRGEHQAAPADDGAVLGRRADDLADLPRRGPLRPEGRLLQRAGGDQRHPLRPGTGVRAAGARGGPAHRLPAVRRRVGGGERAPQGRATCST